MARPDRSEIRCMCSRRPLLATYGVDRDGKAFVHVKVYKQSRIYGEVFVSANAEIKIRCRECLRLQRVKIVYGRPELTEQVRMDPLSRTFEYTANIASEANDEVE